MLLADFAKLQSTKGGSKETELNELAVKPSIEPSAKRVVITVTPVANCDKAVRKWRVSNAGCLARGAWLCIGFPKKFAALSQIFTVADVEYGGFDLFPENCFC